MTTEPKPTISKRGVNVDEWRNRTGQSPLNLPKEEITGCLFFPKHDPATLLAYVKKHNLPF